MSEPDAELALAFNTKNRSGSTGMTIVYFTVIAEGQYYERNKRSGMIVDTGCGLSNGVDEVFNFGTVWTHSGWSTDNNYGPYTYFTTGFKRSKDADQVHNTLWSAHSQKIYEKDQWNGYQGRAQMVAVTFDTEHTNLYIGDDGELTEVPSSEVASNVKWSTHWADWKKASLVCGFDYKSVNGGNYPFIVCVICAVFLNRARRT
ncbi:hypothetical protein CYMTET_4500 [Cymbomonas tetramitiformis]|uniref:Uncharacterized protein n=1 Tax=Cymbomonas tetramitiformis TaxID=36881 RepID=A0AAE0H185_9CHLO|nr:hypothetical protein CYMTET_4500 [Cymbomonas tetramitiformis]